MNKGRRLRRAHESYKGEGRAREERKPKLAVVELCSDRQRMGRLGGWREGRQGGLAGAALMGLKMQTLLHLQLSLATPNSKAHPSMGDPFASNLCSK